MQLDIFDHSRDVILRNAATDALRTRDAAASTLAIAKLASEYANDPLLPALEALNQRLMLPVAASLDRESASRNPAADGGRRGGRTPSVRQQG